MSSPGRILCIDPSLRGTGYGIVESVQGKARAVSFGEIRNPQKLSQSTCLLRIHERLRDVIAEFSPVLCAVEGVIYVQSFRTAITLGAARGTAVLAATQAGLPVYEFAPRRIKQAVVGRGGAQKDQVAFMVRTLLELRETPSPDAADALAIGLACLNEFSRGTSVPRSPL